MSLDGSESPAPTLSQSSSCGDLAALLDVELFVHEESMQAGRRGFGDLCEHELLSL
uniref:Uncharacterized protein n=1 Tax=Physcomitrium patens TaxID=3218 RepID=A0A2K1JMJ8_PHYPA|nr:hypothetical protein PHYPA_017594 [Physcomitrium patens]